MSGLRAGSSGSGGWERSGNHGRSQLRCAALFCSPVRGFICRNMDMNLVAEMWMHSWGSRGRRFKSGRPDWSEACGSDTAPDSWVLIDGRRYLRKVIMLAE